MGDKKLRACYEDLANQPPEDRGTIIAYARDRGIATDTEPIERAVEAAINAPAPPEPKMPLPMLCHTLELRDGVPVMPDDQTWVMEPKLDGNRLIAHVTAGGTVELYGGRNGTPWDQSALDPIREALAGACPPDTILDGELMVPMTHAHSSDVTHAVASGGTLAVWVFDVLRIAGKAVTQLTWQQRRRLLEAFRFDGKQVMLTPVTPPDWELAQAWVKAGVEGIVCKRKAAAYAPGKRSRDMLKWKPQETMEGRIAGFVEGKNGIAGTIGALKIEIEGSGVKTTVSCPPELSDEILQGVQFPPRIQQVAAWVGRCIEFKHYGLFPSGAPRHPGFVRLRPDRD
jgi:ATP-dependent DNA ligase